MLAQAEMESGDWQAADKVKKHYETSRFPRVTVDCSRNHTGVITFLGLKKLSHTGVVLCEFRLGVGCGIISSVTLFAERDSLAPFSGLKKCSTRLFSL